MQKIATTDDGEFRLSWPTDWFSHHRTKCDYDEDCVAWVEKVKDLALYQPNSILYGWAGEDMRREGFLYANKQAAVVLLW